MKSSKPCELCGCSEINLHDGFYFCTECGTQDNNYLETLVEHVETGKDTILNINRRKIQKVVEKEEREMSDAWYKWHAFNFLIKGTADELLEYGAKPSFKTKLLWVWARYIKKYLKPAEMGLNENSHPPSDPENEEDTDSDVDRPPEDLLSQWDATRDKLVINFSFSLLTSLIYIALNLDKSDITLTHLIKLFRDGLVSVPYNIEKIVPKELKPEKLSGINRGLARFKSPVIRVIAMTLFKRLNLGNPIVPDLRLIIDNHFKELCLPDDLKPLVLSLMHYKPCSFLDVNAKDKLIYKVPAYEFHIMTYIIWALKLCLGLDCKYEIKLSRAAEAINEEEGRPKSYNMNGESAPTNRLFSYREWITFYQFKKNLLRYYCHRYANRSSWDTDDYIALGQHMDLRQKDYKKVINDEMAHEFLNRLSGGEERSLVIPRHEFKPTLTPFHSYTQVLVQHLQDPEIKEKLTEDFTQYSLRYAFYDWNLVNPNSRKQKNVVKGIRVGNKEITDEIYKFSDYKIYTGKMVYVRNCENHNWLTTKPPTLKHLVKVDRLKAKDDDDDDHEPGHTQSDVEEPFDNPPKRRRILSEVDSKSRSISELSLTNSSISNSIKFIENRNILESNKLDDHEKSKLRKWNDSIASNNKFPDIVSDYSFTNSTISNSIQFLDETKIFESSKLNETEKDKLREIHDRMSNPNEIKEEIEGENIFDDDFKTEIKEELKENCGMDYHSDNFQDVSIGNHQTENENIDNESIVSSVDSIIFNESEFDRAKVIREIIIYTCKKHKLPIPAEYNGRTQRNRPTEMGIFAKNCRFERPEFVKKYERNRREELARRFEWKSFVDDYHAAVQDDILNQIAQKVNMAVQNAERTQEIDEAPPCETVTADDTNADASMDIEAMPTTGDKDCDHVSETISEKRQESDEDRLFSEDSEGETYAKELLPKKNPDFDEEKYDPSQLYLKTAEVTDPGEIELDPELPKIIRKKIIKDSKDPSLLTWTEERKKIPRPDSEDEMPLSVLLELRELTKKLSNQESEYLDPLLEEPLTNIKYWFKLYFFPSEKPSQRRVFEDSLETLPKSFTFLLRQCAHMLLVSEGDLYKNLLRFEITSLEKSKIEISAKFKKIKRKGYFDY